MRKLEEDQGVIRVSFIMGAIIAGMLVLLGYLNPPSHKAYNPQQAYDSQEISGETFVPPPYRDPETKLIRESTDKEIEDWRAKRSDLAAQWETADMTHLAFRMGILGMVLLGWTVFETRNAADSAKTTLKIAQDTLEETRKTTIVDQRAYLSLKVVEVSTLNEEAKSKIRVEVRNTGKTPATIMKVRLAAHSRTKAQGDRIDFGDKNRKSRGVIFPGEVTEIKTYLKISGGTFSRFKMGEHHIQIAAFVAYKDVFGRHRRSIIHIVGDEISEHGVVGYYPAHRGNKAS